MYLALRLRTNRVKLFEAFKAAEKPTHVQFANGRTGKIQLLLPRTGLQYGTENIFL
jgi:hypothetical protein